MVKGQTTMQWSFFHAATRSWLSAVEAQVAAAPVVAALEAGAGGTRPAASNGFATNSASAITPTISPTTTTAPVRVFIPPMLPVTRPRGVAAQAFR